MFIFINNECKSSSSPLRKRWDRNPRYKENPVQKGEIEGGGSSVDQAGVSSVVWC